MLKKLENHKEIKEFGRYKVELIKEHQYNNRGSGSVLAAGTGNL